MGNICRSPTAEGVFNTLLMTRRLTDAFEVDSAGTHAYHVGDAPDLRSQKAARDRGVELKHLKARKVTQNDFEVFDYVLTMDEENQAILSENCPDEFRHKVRLFLEYAPHLKHREVPDPYYGGAYGFERVLDMIEAASEGFIEALQREGLIS
jgi:low molecular weight protein-tyrosine phosphatase